MVAASGELAHLRGDVCTVNPRIVCYINPMTKEIRRLSDFSGIGRDMRAIDRIEDFGWDSNLWAKPEVEVESLRPVQE